MGGHEAQIHVAHGLGHVLAGQPVGHRFVSPVSGRFGPAHSGTRVPPDRSEGHPAAVTQPLQFLASLPPTPYIAPFPR
ncbi:hypothetical protein, partial [Paracoccus sanguinis]|uniref:hypothetical protein n=1 Tax=Paracoccus sanguinis TaxID=1545044 RepID=UPI001E4C334D